MKRYPKSDNDGTIAITNQVPAPMQGTFVTDEGELVVEKGIVRPLLEDRLRGFAEEEAAVEGAAFGKRLQGEGRFYRLKEVGAERCRMNYQTTLFSLQDAAAFIDHDTEALAKTSALDLLSRDAKEKVQAGLHPSLFMQDMAPWNMVRQYSIQGTRATVYGSELVPENVAEAQATTFGVLGDQISASLFHVGYEIGDKSSCFMLLSGSAMHLARQCSCEPHELVGRWFLLHRDPALPDGTSLFPSMYVGALHWANGCTNDYGIVIHPRDPYWRRAGGDLDGDAGNVYVPQPYFLPRGPVSRPDYKKDTAKYVSEDVAEQMAEAAADSVTDLLGPTVLSAMKIVERGVDTDHFRRTSAAVAQASVQAKKHAVDVEAVTALFEYIVSVVNRHVEDRPFLSSFFNVLRRTSSVEGKLDVWKDLMAEVSKGTWDDGSPVEQAMIRRIHVIDQLFNDVGWFKAVRTNKLPAVMVDAAIALCSADVKAAILEITEEYRYEYQKIRQYAESDEEDKQVLETCLADSYDKIAVVREKFRIACITGRVGAQQFDARAVQIAVIAYAPARIAAQNVPASLFTELGKRTSRIILQLCDHWKAGEYKVSDLRPIPSCADDFNLFVKGLSENDKLTVEVISLAPRSTRVVLTR